MTSVTIWLSSVSGEFNGLDVSSSLVIKIVECPEHHIDHRWVQVGAKAAWPSPPSRVLGFPEPGWRQIRTHWGSLSPPPPFFQSRLGKVWDSRATGLWRGSQLYHVKMASAPDTLTPVSDNFKSRIVFIYLFILFSLFSLFFLLTRIVAEGEDPFGKHYFMSILFWQKITLIALNRQCKYSYATIIVADTT